MPARTTARSDVLSRASARIALAYTSLARSQVRRERVEQARMNIGPDAPESDTQDRLPAEASLREVVPACLRRIEEQGEGRLDAFCAEHPAHAAEIRALINRLARLGLIETARGAKDGPPEQLGGFRLLERLGGGGMGVVYLAEQTSLGATVALKLIRPEQLCTSPARASASAARARRSRACSIRGSSRSTRVGEEQRRPLLRDGARRAVARSPRRCARCASARRRACAAATISTRAIARAQRPERSAEPRPRARATSSTARGSKPACASRAQVADALAARARARHPAPRRQAVERR